MRSARRFPERLTAVQRRAAGGLSLHFKGWECCLERGERAEIRWPSKGPLQISEGCVLINLETEAIAFPRETAKPLSAEVYN
jgi:hypothetical protein